MEVVYGLIPLMLFIGFLVVLVFIWMGKTGQFDDLDGAANSIFLEDELEPHSNKPSSQTTPADSKETKLSK